MFVHVQMCLKSQHCPRGPNKPCSSPPVNYTTWKSGFNWFYLEQQVKRDHNPDHRPHSRQITGARCTEVAARQSWAEYSSRPTTHSRRQGWAIKDFSVLSEMCSICEQPLYGIMLMILHTNNWYALISDKNLEIFFKSIWKIPSASGHSRSPFTSCRARPSWHNGSSLGPHVLNGYGSMTLATRNTIYGKRDPALVDMWGTSYQNMKYQSSLRRRVITGGSEKTVRVSRRMDCRIGVIKFYVCANN